MKRIGSIMLSLLLAGCGAASSSAPAQPTTASGEPSSAPSSSAAAQTPAAPVTINILAEQNDDPAVQAENVDYINAFNASHPDVQVKAEYMNNDQLRTVIQTRLTSGDIDAFEYDSGPGYGGVLAKAGLVADLSSYYQKYGWPIFDWAKAVCTYGGVTDCIPENLETLGIFYNKTLFAANGLTVPTDLTTFMQEMDTLKAKGIIPLAFGDQPQWPAYHQFSMLMSNIVGNDGIWSKIYGDSPWNDANTVKAIDIFFKQFNDKGYFPKSPDAVTYDDANALFFSGKAAMVPTGSWLGASITATVGTKFEVGVFPFPSIDGSGIHAPVGIGSGWFISKNSKHADAAAEFLDWGLQSDQLKQWGLKVFGTMPAMSFDTTGVDISPLQTAQLAYLTQASKAGPGVNIDVLTPANFNDAMSTGFQNVLDGKLTPQQMADNLQAAYQTAIKSGTTIQKP